MKGLKITALILTTVLCASAFTACKNEKKPVSSGINIISSQKQGGAGVDGENIAIIDPEAEKNNFIFKYNGVNVVINTPMSKVLKSLPENYDYNEAPSCAGQGIAKTYTYNNGSFSIQTNPVEKEDSISMILLSDDTVSTAEGIFIGNTAEQVKAAYGEPDKDASTDNAFVYYKGTSVLTFTIMDGKVTSIAYQAKV